MVKTHHENLFLLPRKLKRMQEPNKNHDKNLQDLLEDAKIHINTQVEYAKLTAIERLSVMMANLITDASVVICFLLAFLFGTFTLALYLSSLLGSYVKGFGVMSLIYILIAFIIYLVKDKYLEKKLINVFVKRFFSKMADTDVEEVENEKV